MNQPQDQDSRRKTLEAIHQGAVDAIITIDQEGLIETVNPATESLFGYTSDELVGENVSKLMPSPYRDEHDNYLRSYMTTGVRQIIGIGREVVAQKKDGTIFPIHLAVSEVLFDDRRVFAGFVRDLTDLKRIELQEAALGRIVEDSLNEIFIFDADTLHFIQVNRGARENLGYTLAELEKLTPVDIKPEFTKKQFIEAIRPLRDGEQEKLNFRTIHQRKNGSVYDVDVNLQMTMYQTKRAFVANILDITQRRKAERLVEEQQQSMQAELQRQVDLRTRALEQAQAELVQREKLATLGQVSGGIAHEIRNPLNAIKTSAYYLLHVQSPSPTKLQEHLQRIDRQVAMIDSVITALSDVAKLPEAKLQPTAIDSVLRKIINSMNLPLNIETIYRFDEPARPVLVDEQQIEIAFRNLIRNARDAMQNGGKLIIGTENRGPRVCVYVEDTGEGIAPEDLSRILEPLFSTKARGMGLGLSISRAIVEKNRGQLSVQSEPGVGSRFSVNLQAEPSA